MQDTSKKSRAEQGVSLVVVVMAAGLLVGGVFVAPPVYERVVPGGVIESAAVRAVAWTVSGALAASGLALWGFRRRISGAELCLLGGTIVVCGVLGELALFAVGVAPFKRVILSTPELAEWWEREGPWGPRFVPERYGDYDYLEVNAAGYADRDEFSVEAVAARPRRVLLLGDSFTQGASASKYERSFAAILDRVLGEETVVWNMGIGGTGQRQDSAVLEAVFPVLEPQLVVLSFCLNDFQDNEYPLGAHYVFVNEKWVRAYALGEDGAARLLSPEAAYRRAFHATESVSDLVYASRILTLAIGAVRRLQQGEGVAGPVEEVASEAARVETRRLLGEIRRYVEGRGAALRVMIVPFREHLDGQEQRYQTILEIAAELGLEVWEVGPLLDVADYAPEPDSHWNDSGHGKVGSFLGDKIEAVYAER